MGIALAKKGRAGWGICNKNRTGISFVSERTSNYLFI